MAPVTKGTKETNMKARKIIPFPRGAMAPMSREQRARLVAQGERNRKWYASHKRNKERKT
jgi:hypothetical protein